ncbi:MAG: M23 family metallopeptidase [Bacteroidales bacterium]
MSIKKRYKFNAETLAYEVHRIPLRERFSKGFVLFLLSLIAFLGYYAFYTGYLNLEPPKTISLRQKSVELHSKLELLNKRFEQNNIILLELQMRDNNVYRPIFGMEEISQDIRNAGFGGVDRYAALENKGSTKFLIDIEKKMDVLYKKAFVQSRSYDEVAILAKRTGDMALCVPAIPPVSLDRTKLSSFFGFRSDPFTRSPRMHTGVDLSGRKGESIYATGDGKVIEIGFNFFGYGTEVVIDHGFGYKTRYAHLSRVHVKVGEVVKRGDQIADMGESGRSKGVHLHYEVLYKNNRVNPLNYYNQDIKKDEFMAMVRPKGKNRG